MKVDLIKPNEMVIGKMFEWFNDEEEAYLIRQTNEPMSKQEFENFLLKWLKPYGILFGIRLRQKNEDTGESIESLAGYVAFEAWEEVNGKAYIHAYIDKKNRRSGILSKAWEKALKVFFREHRMNKLKAILPVKNEAIIKYAEKIGAKEEGLLQREIYQDGRFEDAKLFCIHRQDYISSLGGKINGSSGSNSTGSGSGS